jgi:hypothetical protein
MLVAGIALAAFPTFSQDEIFSTRALAGRRTESRTTRQTAAGVLGSYRYFYSKHHGVEANYGYALNTLSYGLAASLVGEDLLARGFRSICPSCSVTPVQL